MKDESHVIQDRKSHTKARGWILAGHMDIYLYSWGEEEAFCGQRNRMIRLRSLYHHPSLSWVALDAGEGF